MCADDALPIPSDTYAGMLIHGSRFPVNINALGAAASSVFHPDTAACAAAHILMVFTLYSVLSWAAETPARMSSGSDAGVAAHARFLFFVRQFFFFFQVQLWGVYGVTVVDHDVRRCAERLLGTPEERRYCVRLREVGFESVETDRLCDCEVGVSRGRGDGVAGADELCGDCVADAGTGAEDEGCESHGGGLGLGVLGWGFGGGGGESSWIL